MSIASRIKQLRTQKNYTQKDLASLLSVKPTTVSGWELGRNEPSIDMINKLSSIFSVTTDYLIGRSEKTNEDQDDFDLEQALNNAHSFSGKPLSDHDRKVAKDVLRSLFQD